MYEFFGQAVGTRMVGGNESMINGRGTSERCHDRVDKLGPVVRLNNLGKTKVRPNAEESTSNCGGSLVLQGAYENESREDVNVYENKVEPILRGWERTSEVNGNVVKRERGRDGCKRMIAVARDRETLAIRSFFDRA